MAAPIESDVKSEIDEKMCEIEATVVTGFEIQAQEEVTEKFNVKSTTARGKVNFFIPIDQAKKVTELCSVDNAIVVLNHFHDFVFADDEETIMQQLRNLVSKLDWRTGLDVWGHYHHFPHPILDTPKPRHKQSTEGVTGAQTSLQGETPAEAQAPPTDKPTEAADPDKSPTDSSEPSTKRARPADWDDQLPAFRVTCYRSGKHIFQSPQAASNFGGQINTHFGWNVSMKNYDIEVILTIEKEHVYVALGLTKESLHRRNITAFSYTTLRPTIAYNMLRFIRIHPGDVICDPMCGSGSIPIEGVMNWQKCVHICGDINPESVPKAKENLDALNTKRLTSGLKDLPLSVFHWDACSLPLRNESVDVFVTDMPFGKRSGSKLRNWHLYPRVLRDMARVSKPGTGRACLLTQDKKCFLKSLTALEGLWRRGPTIAVNIGGLAAGVYILHRTARKYMTYEELKIDAEVRQEKKRLKFEAKSSESTKPESPEQKSPSHDD